MSRSIVGASRISTRMLAIEPSKPDYGCRWGVSTIHPTAQIGCRRGFSDRLNQD
jgi:hypothetical protein